MVRAGEGEAERGGERLAASGDSGALDHAAMHNVWPDAMRWLMRSKIHNATVTQANLAYVGSVTIDQDLLDRVGLWPGEKVLVVSNTSGARLETYVIAGEAGSGDMCMNGAAAHLIAKGDEIIIMGFELTDRPIKPKVILVDRANRFVRWLAEAPRTTVAG